MLKASVVVCALLLGGGVRGQNELEAGIGAGDAAVDHRLRGGAQRDLGYTTTATTTTTSTTCAKKTLDVAGVYGSIANAQACMKHALAVFKTNWVPEVTGPALRASFHDCGTYTAAPTKTSAAYQAWSLLGPVAKSVPLKCGGCNGSIKQEFAFGKSVNWQIFAEQNGMQLWYDFLFGYRLMANTLSYTTVANLIKTAKYGYYDCRKMSNADIISLLGIYAVKQAGGVPAQGCPWMPGRKDVAADWYDDTTLLPSEASNAEALKAQQRCLGLIRSFSLCPRPLPLVCYLKFAKYDFYSIAQNAFGQDPYKLIATLSGAHTVGRSRVHPENPTSLGIDELSQGPLNTFDGIYYDEVYYKYLDGKNAGWFESDRHGRCNNLSNPGQKLEYRICQDANSPMAQYYKAYADEYHAGTNYLLASNFCASYQAMSTIGYAVTADVLKATSANFVVPPGKDPVSYANQLTDMLLVSIIDPDDLKTATA
ncbi:hypothetical protein JKP88DRAFT_249754 [Tribonema minus]|uniref:Plant heme peroxidase family profile domain-containing protein n=1 Tax=Tribonema minus TaxID=303371 RepID=A0A836C8T4_9STRA|nr:hypothetical protein JKP88DRAFT_249754 [Tribonema minus]